MCSLIIENKDLLHNKYDISILEQNIDNLRLWTILKTQHLTPEFCFNYILEPNEKYAKNEDDESICVNDVVKWQPHINVEDIYKLFVAFK